MKATTERIFANDIQMMLWQEKNCCRCTKAINTSKATVYKCALQRDMECQQKGLWQINERSVKLVKGVDVCPLMKPKETIIPCVDAPVIDAHEFAKGKPIEQPKQEAPKKEVTQTFSDAEIKAAEKRMFDTILNNEIAPNVGNAIKNVQASMSEARFKELARRDAQTMLDTFTWEENMMIAFVPLIISKVAWVYAEKVLAYCAEHRLSEYKKHGRVVKMLRQEYIDTLCKDLDRRHVRHIETQTEQFMDEINHHLTILWLQANTYIKNTTGYDMAHDTMRTDAMVAILMVRYLKAHDNKMNAIIKAKMGHSESITNPQMIDLEGLMKAYLPKGFVVGTNYQLDLCAKIFENSLSKIEFDVAQKMRYNVMRPYRNGKQY